MGLPARPGRLAMLDVDISLCLAIIIKHDESQPRCQALRHTMDSKQTTLLALASGFLFLSPQWGIFTCSHTFLNKSSLLLFSLSLFLGHVCVCVCVRGCVCLAGNFMSQ